MIGTDELLAEIGALAPSLGPAVRPAGSQELLRALTETARQLFGAAACSLALLSEDESELVYTTAAGRGADDVSGMRIPGSQGNAGSGAGCGSPASRSPSAIWTAIPAFPGRRPSEPDTSRRPCWLCRWRPRSAC